MPHHPLYARRTRAIEEGKRRGRVPQTMHDDAGLIQAVEQQPFCNNPIDRAHSAAGRLASARSNREHNRPCLQTRDHFPSTVPAATLGTSEFAHRLPAALAPTHPPRFALCHAPTVTTAPRVPILGYARRACDSLRSCGARSSASDRPWRHCALTEAAYAAHWSRAARGVFWHPPPRADVAAGIGWSSILSRIPPDPSAADTPTEHIQPKIHYK